GGVSSGCLSSESCFSSIRTKRERYKQSDAGKSHPFPHICARRLENSAVLAENSKRLAQNHEKPQQKGGLLFARARAYIFICMMLLSVF
ncbi:MAG: hypothetical protein IKZ20_07325, partial [Bacteroidaceae bacterium]|nr:hypothetical protein [Bacteroidaceae bacterium]